MTPLPQYHPDIAIATHQVIATTGQIIEVCELCINHACARGVAVPLSPSHRHVGCQCNHATHFVRGASTSVNQPA